MAPARKYPPLNRYLEALDPTQPSVSLTFAELETLLGAPLPPSARLTFYWSHSGVSRVNWELSGFTAKLDRLEQRVRFTRRMARTLPPDRPASHDSQPAAPTSKRNADSETSSETSRHA